MVGSLPNDSSHHLFDSTPPSDDVPSSDSGSHRLGVASFSLKKKLLENNIHNFCHDFKTCMTCVARPGESPVNFQMNILINWP